MDIKTENKPYCFREIRNCAFAQVNTYLVATYNNQVDRGQTSCAVSVPHLLGDGASIRTYNKETEIRCSEESTNWGPTFCDEVCKEVERVGSGEAWEVERGGGMWDTGQGGDCPPCCIIIETSSSSRARGGLPPDRASSEIDPATLTPTWGREERREIILPQSVM